MQEQFTRMKETYEKDIRKVREDKTSLEIEVASLDKVGNYSSLYEVNCPLLAML